MQQKSDAQLESSLDHNQYSESQLIEIKIPMNMPYQASWADYERYDGEVKLDGITYKYVKRKLSNDTLYLKCIPNTRKMNLETAKDDFFKNNNDIAQNNSKKSDNSKSVTLKKLLSEYDENIFYSNTDLISISVQPFSKCIIEGLITFAHISPEQPPDYLSA